MIEFHTHNDGVSFSEVKGSFGIDVLNGVSKEQLLNTFGPDENNEWVVEFFDSDEDKYIMVNIFYNNGVYTVAGFTTAAVYYVDAALHGDIKRVEKNESGIDKIIDSMIEDE